MEGVSPLWAAARKVAPSRAEVAPGTGAGCLPSVAFTDDLPGVGVREITRECFLSGLIGHGVALALKTRALKWVGRWDPRRPGLEAEEARERIARRRPHLGLPFQSQLSSAHINVLTQDFLVFKFFEPLLESYLLSSYITF